MKRVVLILAAVLAFIQTTGCADMQDIDTRIYLSGIAIDFTESGYRFCFQTANPVGITNAVESSEIEYANRTVEAKTLTAALAAIERGITGKLDLEHLSCVVIGKIAAQGDILSLLEPLFENSVARRQCVVVCCNSSAVDLFEKQGANAMEISLIMKNYTGDELSNKGANLWRLFCAKSSGGGYYIYRLSTDESVQTSASDTATPLIDGSTAYSQAGGSCRFDAQQALVLRLLTEDSPKGIYIFDETSQIGFEIVDMARKTRLSARENELYYEIDISTVCSDLGNGSIDRFDFEKRAAELLYERLSQVIDMCSQNGLFYVIGLEDEYRQRFYNAFSNLSPLERNERMKEIPIELKLNVSLERAEGYK